MCHENPGADIWQPFSCGVLKKPWKRPTNFDDFTAEKNHHFIG